MARSLRVVHVNTLGTGGAARAAARLHDGLLRRGVESMFLTVDNPASESWRRLSPRATLAARLRRRIHHERLERDLKGKRPAVRLGQEQFSDDRTVLGRDLVAQLPSCDIINLHWVVGLVDYGFFFRHIPGPTPIVWTLHDMNPFTGGCHYSMGCEGFASQCGACPQISVGAAHDLSREVHRRKSKALAVLDPKGLHVVSPSRWLASQARSSSLFRRFPVGTIPYGLDTDVFNLRSRAVARAVFEIPEDAKVLLFLADAVDNKRKGLQFVEAILPSLAASVPALTLMTVGRGNSSSRYGPRHVHVSHLDNDRLLSFVYSAADLFVIPATEDNLPNTVLEAMACGLPVVGFDAGGIPDMVRSGTNGIVVPVGDTKALARAVRDVLTRDEDRARMAKESRSLCEREYGLLRQADDYIALYESLTGAGALGRAEAATRP